MIPLLVNFDYSDGVARITTWSDQCFDAHTKCYSAGEMVEAVHEEENITTVEALGREYSAFGFSQTAQEIWDEMQMLEEEDEDWGGFDDEDEDEEI